MGYSGRSRILKRVFFLKKTHPLPIVHLNSHTHFSLFTGQKGGGALKNFRTIEEPPLNPPLHNHPLLCRVTAICCILSPRSLAYGSLIATTLIANGIADTVGMLAGRESCIHAIRLLVLATVYS
jgi:hypothetical protein